MAGQQEETAVVRPENDVATKPEGHNHPSVDPQKQLDYWRWVQLQVLRGRARKSPLRE